MRTFQKLERHIRNLESELLKPEVRFSAERISELLDKGFFEFGSSGRMYNYTPGDVFDDNGSTYEMEDLRRTGSLAAAFWQRIRRLREARQDT